MLQFLATSDTTNTADRGDARLIAATIEIITGQGFNAACKNGNISWVQTTSTNYLECSRELYSTLQWAHSINQGLPRGRRRRTVTQQKKVEPNVCSFTMAPALLCEGNWRWGYLGGHCGRMCWPVKCSNLM